MIGGSVRRRAASGGARQTNARHTCQPALAPGAQVAHVGPVVAEHLQLGVGLFFLVKVRRDGGRFGDGGGTLLCRRTPLTRAQADASSEALMPCQYSVLYGAQHGLAALAAQTRSLPLSHLHHARHLRLELLHQLDLRRRELLEEAHHDGWLCAVGWASVARSSSSERKRRGGPAAKKMPRLFSPAHY